MNKSIERYKHRNFSYSAGAIQRQLDIVAFAEMLEGKGFTVRRIVPTSGRIMTARPVKKTPAAIWLHVAHMSLDYNIIEDSI